MAEPVLDFGVVSREFRSLVSRRRELMTFLGSAFAAVGIFLQNVLEGKLPQSLEAMQRHAFLTYAIALLGPAVIVALRIAKLHAGMVINGVFYRSILQRTHKPQMDPKGAARLNWAGVSTQFFLLTMMLAGFAAALVVLTLGFPGWMAAGIGVSAMTFLLVVFVRFHHTAGAFAVRHIAAATVEPVTLEEIEDHVAGSRDDSNHDLLAVIAFVGLILFSVFESLSGLGAVSAEGTEIATGDLLRYGERVYSTLSLVTCAMCAVIYLRLAVSICAFSLELDPTDNPFRPFKLTDTFLGYCLLAFFVTIASHVWATPLVGDDMLIAIVDAAVFTVCVLAYPATLIVAGRGRR